MVYSTLDAIRIAEAEPGREVVFFAIGFETTTPPTALAIRAAEKKGLKNFSILCNHVHDAAGDARDPRGARDGDDAAPVRIDGFIGPAHVSTVIGTRPYEPFAEEYGKPVVIAGFEPLDVLQAILMLVRQINEGRPRSRTSTSAPSRAEGNLKAQGEVAEVFETARVVRMARARLAAVQRAAAAAEAFAPYDAERRFGLDGEARRATIRPANAGRSCAA